MLLWLVLAYLAVSIGIGLYGASKVHNAKDYVTAGRNLPFAIVLAMVLTIGFQVVKRPQQEQPMRLSFL